MKHNQSSNKNIHAIKHQSKKRAMAQPKVQHYNLATVLQDWNIESGCSLAKALEYISKKANSSEEERVYLNIAIFELGDWIYQYYEFLSSFESPCSEPEVYHNALPQEPFIKDKTQINPLELSKIWQLSSPYKRAIIHIHKALLLTDIEYLAHLKTAQRYLCRHFGKVREKIHSAKQ
ncbi:MAG: hypothetical protein J0H87_08495 [Holosporales bacterium]|nr:hypothetical protein [Holosporales bacterium]